MVNNKLDHLVSLVIATPKIKKKYFDLSLLIFHSPKRKNLNKMIF